MMSYCKKQSIFHPYQKFDYISLLKQAYFVFVLTKKVILKFFLFTSIFDQSKI